jgi:hypothetical protein
MGKHHSIAPGAISSISRSKPIMANKNKATPLCDATWRPFSPSARTRRGSLKPGKLADLAVLSADPLTVPTMVGSKLGNE